MNGPTNQLHRAPLLVLAALTASLSPIAADEARSDPEKRPPNIVFILADDLGYTDVACYGSKYYETPNIDRLATQGMRFTDGYACPNCAPTRAALMSGQYGPRTGIYTVGSIERFNWRTRPLRPVDNVGKLALDNVTVAQALKSAGYTTGLFGKWHLGETPEYHPAKRGFDSAIVSMGQHFKFKTTPPIKHDEDAYLADFLTDQAVDFIRKNKEKPFFVYLPHFGVHAPLQAKAALIDRFRKKETVGGHHNPTYAAMISSVDESVGRILTLLDELKLSENTLVIFSSDNGGVGGYGREGLGKGGDITDNAPLRGGKGMLYEGGVRVPYVFRWTGKIRAGTVCREPINSVDLYPTLLELAGAKPPGKHVLDGQSYVSLLTSDGNATLKREGIYWHFPGYLGASGDKWRTTPAGAIRSGDWKLLEFFEDNHLELYNLREDQGERTNLAEKMPEKTRALHAKLRTWREQIKAPMPTPNKPQPR